MVVFLSAVGSDVLLVALFRFVSSGCFSKMALVGVPWSWIMMSWSSSVCSLLLLFDAWRLLFAISGSLFLVCNLDSVLQIFLCPVLWSRHDYPCQWFVVDCHCFGILPFQVALHPYRILANLLHFSPIRPRMATLLCVGRGAGKFELALPVFTDFVVLESCFCIFQGWHCGRW